MKIEVQLDNKTTVRLLGFDVGSNHMRNSTLLGSMEIFGNTVTLDMSGACELRAALGTLIDLGLQAKDLDRSIASRSTQ